MQLPIIQSHIIAHALSHFGRVRGHNEDAAGIRGDGNSHLLQGPKVQISAEIAGRCLMLVADGLGGEEAGEVASRIAVETLLNNWNDEIVDVSDWLKGQISIVYERLCGHVASHPTCKGMATTLTALVCDNNTGYFAHVGDSRLYVLHNKQLTQLTEDHTTVWQDFQAGRISESEMRSHPERHILERALDSRLAKPPIPQSGQFPIHAGDRLLLCSDGLTDGLTDDLLASALRSKKTPLGSVAEGLLEDALEASGRDNITLIVAELTRRWPWDSPTGE